MRVLNHPVLGKLEADGRVHITVDGQRVEAIEGEPIAVALLASGKSALRYTMRFHEPRGIYCAIGRCADCLMVVDGVPNVRTCITPVREGMRVETQHDLGQWGADVK